MRNRRPTAATHRVREGRVIALSSGYVVLKVARGGISTHGRAGLADPHHALAIGRWVRIDYTAGTVGVVSACEPREYM